MFYGEALFRLGIAVMCAAGGFGVLSILIFSLTGKRLRKTLDAEYGKKRHE